jgi:hypothetical protein
MTKIECPTCEGEGKIYDRRVDKRERITDRNEEEEEEEIEKTHYCLEATEREAFSKHIRYIKKDWKSYSYPETSRYACKIDYNDEAKELIADLRKLGKSSGFTIRVRGSGPRAPQHRKDGKDLRRIYDQSLPLKYAEQVRIYIDHK